MAATVAVIRYELSTEFTQWMQRLARWDAASPGMKPGESLAPHGLLVAANYRPTGMKPVVAKTREKFIHSAANEWADALDCDESGFGQGDTARSAVIH